jgi:hypothetical protein
MTKYWYYLGILPVVLVVSLFFAWQISFFNKAIRHVVLLQDEQLAAVAAVVGSTFSYSFNVKGILDEVGRMDDSSSPYWWLNSGGRFYIASSTGKTVYGELSQFSKWRIAYAAANATDTDNGYHPQNIFRLVTRSKWQNFSQEVSFQNAKLNMSTSTNRNASNGILLFNRYQDGNNLYYTGVRVDGAIVIKKKINGTYYTLAYKQFYTNGTPYSRDTNPNLIPSQKWIGLKSEVRTNLDNTVSIKVFIDRDKIGSWVLVAEATDDGKTYGGSAILNEGYAGIRTDFMDVEFDDYKVVKF